MNYPIGIQNFEELRSENYLYVDKTELIWQLVTTGKYFFLSRPRRFGKSLLLSTIEAYFKGRKDLFAGLKIAEYEKEWIEYPVIHIDLNAKLYDSKESLKIILDNYLDIYENRYGLPTTRGEDVEIRFANLIRELHDSTDKQVVILIDEYDKPLLNNVSNKDTYAEIQSLLKAFYGVIKSCDAYIKFAMLTGVARFGKVSVFSDLNNLNDISLNADFNAICGISSEELHSYFETSIEELADKQGESVDAMKERLKQEYDGYHFADPRYAKDIYNPFSILSCFYEMRISDYWFETGTSSMILQPAIAQGFDFMEVDEIDATEAELKGVNVPEDSPISLLYQTGYLTIKHYEDRFRTYTLGFPNGEVKRGFAILESISRRRNGI